MIMRGRTNSQPCISFITGTENMLALPYRTMSSSGRPLLETQSLTIDGTTYKCIRIAYSTYYDCTVLSFKFDEDYAPGATHIIFSRGTTYQIIPLNGSGSYSFTREFVLGQQIDTYLASTTDYPVVLDLDRVVQYYVESISVPSVNGQIMIDTGTPGKIIGFDLLEPPSGAVEGDVYFTPYERGALLGERLSDNGFMLRLGEAYQLENGVWNKKNAWLSQKGMWRQISYVWNGAIFSDNSHVDGNITYRLIPLQSTLSVSFSSYMTISVDSSASSTIYGYFYRPLSKEMLRGFTKLQFTVPGGATNSSNANRIGLAGSIGESSITDWLAYVAIGTTDAASKSITIPEDLPDTVYLALSVYKNDYWNIRDLHFS